MLIPLGPLPLKTLSCPLEQAHPPILLFPLLERNPWLLLHSLVRIGTGQPLPAPRPAVLLAPTRAPGWAGSLEPPAPLPGVPHAVPTLSQLGPGKAQLGKAGVGKQRVLRKGLSHLAAWIPDLFFFVEPIIQVVFLGCSAMSWD